ncbi:MAG: acetyl-CoA carboxylase biotin carboxyl carrier protein [Lachnospiraceae bacterium]
MEYEQLLKLIQAVSDSSLTAFEYEENGVRVKLKKEKAESQVPAAAEGVPNTMAQLPLHSDAQQGIFLSHAQEDIPQGEVVKSPLVGTFYSAPSEEEPSFVRVGDTVKKGQVLAIVEAMKLMNEIESEYDGTIVEVLVENASPVEYGQPLFRIA